MITLDWADESAIAVAEYLRAQGEPSIVWETPEGLIIERDGLEALLAQYVRTHDRDTWVAPLPAAIRTHAGHLRDYEQAVRDGQAPSSAQTAHVLADVIAWIRLSEGRL